MNAKLGSRAPTERAKRRMSWTVGLALGLAGCLDFPGAKGGSDAAPLAGSDGAGGVEDADQGLADLGGSLADAVGRLADAGGGLTDASGGLADAGGGPADASGGLADASGGLTDASGGLADAAGGLADAAGGSADVGTGGRVGADVGTGGVAPPAEVWAQVSAGGADPDEIEATNYYPEYGTGHTCALTSLGRLFCWGAGWDGQLGLERDTTRVDTPREVQPGTRWARVSAGALHTCGIRAPDDPEAPGALYCWGRSTRGELGLSPGAPAQDWLPGRVGDATDWHEVSSGGAHTCGIRGDDRQLYCWGENEIRQCGQPAGVGPGPRRVGALDDFSLVSAALAHTCALRRNGELYCFGDAKDGKAGPGSEPD